MSVIIDINEDDLDERTIINVKNRRLERALTMLLECQCLNHEQLDIDTINAIYNAKAALHG